MKKFKFLAVFLLFLCIVVAGFIFSKIHQIQNKIFIHPQNIAQSNDNFLEKYFKNKAAFNILLLGYGGRNHDGAYLTDSIMVVHIDPATQKISLISIPRDTWVQIPTNGTKGSYWKINSAYELGLDDENYPNKQPQFKGADGGGRLIEHVVSQVTRLPIGYFVGMDFSGFKNTIDTLNGVDVNVETAFTDPEYPIDGKEDDLCGHTQIDLPALETEATQSPVETVFPCRYQNLHFDAGMQHMDGEKALSYVRSRHSLEDGTDFGRAKRQRNLLLTVKQKVFSAGFIPQIIPFTNSLGDDLRTDMGLNDVKTLIQNASNLNKYQVSTIALTNQNVLVDTYSDDGQAVLEPKDGLDQWNLVRDFIASSLQSEKQLISPTVKVENGTNVVGLATLAYNRLQDKDFNLLPPANSDVNLDTTSITIYSSQIDQHIIDDLKTEFGVSKVGLAQPTSEQTYDILIVVGKDYNLRQGKKLIN